METLDFNKALAARREKQEADRLLIFFKQMMAVATDLEKQEVRASILERDEDRYKAATEPLIMRMTVRELN